MDFPGMKKIAPLPPDRGSELRRTFIKLEIEDAERRPGLGERLRRLFRRREKSKQAPPGR
jgi:hypothetical protein